MERGDFLALWGLGTLFGKPIKVDMPLTRKHGVLKTLVGCVDQTKIAKSLTVLIKGKFYRLNFEVEPPNLDIGNDVTMMDFDADLDEDPKGGPAKGSANDQARFRLEKIDRKSTRLNSSHSGESRMPSSA